MKRAQVAEDGMGPALTLVLGRTDSPTDGIRDYCSRLTAALARHAKVDIVQVPWAEEGWLASWLLLWRKASVWRGRWVLLQYTALQWSRRGFPMGLLPILLLLRLRGAKLAHVFHDPIPQPPRADAGIAVRWLDLTRRLFQVLVMHTCARLSRRSFVTLPPSQIPWIQWYPDGIFFAPAGSNIHFSPQGIPEDPKTFTIAVFGVTTNSRRTLEAQDIAYAIGQTAKLVAGIELRMLGRGCREVALELSKSLENSGVKLVIHDVLPEKEVGKQLSECSAQLFVRGHISSRRGSAVAGIAAGLPIVAYRGAETGSIFDGSGVLLAPEGDRDALVEHLVRLARDGELRRILRGKNIDLADRLFSWRAIARVFVKALSLEENALSDEIHAYGAA